MSENIDPIDQQLIALLAEKPAEELSFEELDLLRQRLGESAALRAALAAHLQHESYLTQVLGDFSLSPETIIHRAQAEQAAQARPWQWLAGGAICLALFAVLVGVFMSALRQPDGHTLTSVTPRPELPAESEDPKPAVPESPAPESSPATPEPTESTEPSDVADGTPKETPDPAPRPQFEVAIPAERFARGSVKVDNSEFGTPTNVVVHSGGTPKRNVEYEIVVPKAEQYFVHVRYASGEKRPLQATLNGKQLERAFTSKTTGGFHPPQQKWHTEGKFSFRRGRNQLRLSTEGLFPSLNCIVVSTAATISDETAPPIPHGELAQAEPWTETLQRPAPASYLEVAYDGFDYQKSLPQMPEVLRWFETAPDQQRRVGETHTRLGKCAEIDGVFKLRWPWQEHAALRLALENHNRLRLHFYSGTVGVTLVYYQDEGYAWAAYTTTRKDAQSHQPETLALIATDAGRALRSEYRGSQSRGCGPIDIRWHAGEIIVNHGDVVLLRAPLPGLPQDVYLDGRAAFHGIAIVPSQDSPAASPQSTVAAQEHSPAALAWHEGLTEGAKLVKHDDGTIELLADNAKGSGFISAPLGYLTPSEIVLELEGVTRGTGVYLSPQKPTSHTAVRFVKNNRFNPPVMCAMLRQDEPREGDFGDWHERMTMPVPATKQYVRLIGGAGIARHAISSDGIHWAQWEDPIVALPAGATHLCLHYVSAEPNSRIKLNKITVRPLAALAQQVASAELLAKAPALTNQETPTIGEWLLRVSASQPDNVTTSEWRRTCAIRSLGAGCDADLGQRLVQLILDDAEARQLSMEELLALYRDAFQLLDTRHNHGQAQVCWQRYATAADRSEQRPFSAVRMELMTSPVYWRHNFPVADEKLIRRELLQLTYDAQWDALLAFCQQLRFFQQHQRMPLVDWAEATAARQAPGRGSDTPIARLRSSWRPLLIEELSKDAYNILAEMQAILESDAFEDAARMITSLSPDAVSGVAPQGRDRELLVSLPAAIRMAVRDYPQLQQVMNDKFGPLAQLRVRQSVNTNNTAAVELAAVQFEATEAAAEAHRWLGDRALSSGQFARARAEYLRALATASSMLESDLTARLRLTAAMQGEEYGVPVTRPVAFHDTTISPGEFESIVAAMKQANQGGGAQYVVPAEQQRIYQAPAPTGFEVADRNDFKELLGEVPNDEVTRDINALRINWCDRQLATLVDGNVLYVSNRFQIAAYNLDDGQRLWGTEKLPGSAIRARDWTLIPMRPVVTNSVIYARLLYGSGPMLACFDKTNGKLLWNAEQRHNEFLISDPLLIQNQLVALTLVRNDQGQSTLRLTTYDRESGEALVQRNLLRVNDVWWSRRGGEVTPLGDGLVATLGGLSLCCDLHGDLRWIRRPVALPPEEESSWVRQYFERPLVVQNRVVLSQPGVRKVECVDADTGRLAWSQVLPDVETVLGQADGRVIVRTQTAFLAFRLEDGQPLWRHPRPEVFDTALLGGLGGLVYVERQPTKTNKDRFSPRLVWVDPATGIAKSSFTLATLEDAEPQLGPLVAYKDRLWTFWGAGHHKPERDLMELTPKADAPLSPVASALTRDAWAREADPALRQAAEWLFPEWSLLTGGLNGESGLRNDVYGENDVLGICVRPHHPTIFTRQIAPAANTHPKLRMRFNHRTDQDWTVKLSVQFSDRTLWSQDFSKDQSPQQWKDLEVDLSSLAGQSGQLVVKAEYLQPGGEIPTWWKRLEWVP